MAVITRVAKHRRALRALSWSLAVVPLTTVCVALAIFFAADQLYADRVLPGVTVAGVDVGSLTRSATLERLQGELARPWADSTVVATYQGREWRTTNGALGVRPDLDAAADAALAYGKTSAMLDRLDAWADSLRGDARVPLTLVAQGDALERWLAQIDGDVDRTAVSGSIGSGAHGVVGTERVVGHQIDRVGTAASVLAAQS